MSGQFQLAVEELKRFRQSFANVFAMAEWLANENPAALEANVKRLKADSATLIANMRKQAEDEAERNSKGKVEAAERKVKQLIKECDEECKTRVNQAQAQANEIIADARKAGEQLDARVKKARAHVDEALR